MPIKFAICQRDKFPASNWDKSTIWGSKVFDRRAFTESNISSEARNSQRAVQSGCKCPLYRQFYAVVYFWMPLSMEMGLKYCQCGIVCCMYYAANAFLFAYFSNGKFQLISSTMARLQFAEDYPSFIFSNREDYTIAMSYIRGF